MREQILGLQELPEAVGEVSGLVVSATEPTSLISIDAGCTSGSTITYAHLWQPGDSEEFVMRERVLALQELPETAGATAGLDGPPTTVIGPDVVTGSTTLVSGTLVWDRASSVVLRDRALALPGGCPGRRPAHMAGAAQAVGHVSLFPGRAIITIRAR